MNLKWGKAFISELWQLSVKPHCAICARPASTTLCPDCCHQLEDCRIKTTAFVQQNNLPILAWGEYTGLLKQALGQLKYHQKSEIAKFLGQQLGMAWQGAECINRNVIVLPIPLHQQRERERGYNQATLIANSFCHMTGLKLAANGLVRIKETEAQFNLSPQERFINVAQAFRLGLIPAQKNNRKSILLIDDIYTTGATVLSAAQTLRNAGWRVSGVVVVAMA